MIEWASLAGGFVLGISVWVLDTLLNRREGWDHGFYAGLSTGLVFREEEIEDHDQDFDVIVFDGDGNCRENTFREDILHEEGDGGDNAGDDL